jgi:HlyD family secretion protein
VTRALLIVCLVLGAGCRRAAAPDAYGNVEATEVVVGAEAGGQLTSFDVTEGRRVAAAAVVGTIDSTELALERDQVAAQRAASASHVTEVAQQIDVLAAERDATAAQRDAARAQRASLAAQLEIAARAHERARRLFAQQAGTSQQLDQAERDFRVLEQQAKAQDDQIAAQEHQLTARREQIDATRAVRETAARQVTSLDAQLARIGERIRKSQVRNPSAGTVLATYAKAGEIVQPGQPLYRIADLDAVDVRAYVTEPQLAALKLGGAAQITIDTTGGARRTLPGTLTWISSEAEFAPTPIQTREERADLVYAVKIRVANTDGVLKIGMPADVMFDAAGGVAPARQ